MPSKVYPAHVVSSTRCATPFCNFQLTFALKLTLLTIKISFMLPTNPLGVKFFQYESKWIPFYSNIIDVQKVLSNNPIELEMK